MKGAGWASINNEEDASKESEKEEYFYDEEEAKKKPKESNEASFATHVILISLYVLLWTSESLVIHAAKDIDYEKASVTVSIEIFKLTLATGIFIGLNGGKIKDIIAYADRGVLFFMLGLIYCMYNLMRYYALTVSDPGTYRVFINLRVVSTGLLYQFFRVGDPLTPRKWGALILLMIGCSVMKWGELSVAWFPILIIGILAMLGSAGGVYNEKILKTDMAIDINLQNVYLYFFTICFTLLTLLFTDPYLLVSPAVLFRNWTWWMIPMILLGGGGGFMTALMLKHLNVLTKEYANGFEMLMTTLFSFYFFGYPPLDFKVFASIMVVTGSIFMFYWERMPFNRAKEVKG